MERSLIALLAVFSALLLFSLKSNQQLGDSLVYAVSVETGENLYHPHHLLYNPAVKLVRSLVLAVPADHPELLAAQLHNIGWAVVAVLSMFVLVRRLTGMPGLAFLAGLALLFSNGLWELSTQATLYSSAAAAPLLLAAILLNPAERRISIWRAILVSLLLALAVLYHQVNVLLCLPLAWYLISSEGKRGSRLFLGIASAAGLLTLLVYIWAFVQASGAWSLSGFIHFCTAYASEICWGGECVASPASWGTVNHLTLGGVGVLLQSILWNFVALPERFAVLFAYLLGAGLLALLVYHLRVVIQGGAAGRIRAFLLVWATSQILFLWWWLPDYAHPLLIPAMPVLFLVFLSAGDFVARYQPGWPLKPALVVGTVAAIAAVGGVNAYLRVLPMHANSSDSYVEASELAVVHGGPIEYFTSYRVWNHLRYYFGKQGEARLAKYPLVYFYGRATLPAIYQDQAAARLVDMRFVRPDYTLSGYSDTWNGYASPDAWLRYLAWLLRFEYDENQNLAASREFRVLQFSDGESYLLVLPERQPAESLTGLLGALDKQYTERAGLETGPFLSWMEETNPRLSAAAEQGANP